MVLSYCACVQVTQTAAEISAEMPASTAEPATDAVADLPVPDIPDTPITVSDAPSGMLFSLLLFSNLVAAVSSSFSGFGIMAQLSMVSAPSVHNRALPYLSLHCLSLF